MSRATLAVLVLASPLLAADPPKKVPLPAEFDTADLVNLLRYCPKPVEPRKDAKTGFVVGGVNKTDLIRKLTALNGRPIADLEADMRPGAAGEVGSDKGFLGKEEKLLDVLAADNETVVTKLGLTHQAIADELNAVAALASWLPTREHKDEVQFVYRGRRFKATPVFWKGYQYSPFKDGTKTSADLRLENLDTGKTLSYSLLVPLMIERYGFYEGTGTPYRVDPEKVIEVLDFLKPAKK